MSLSGDTSERLNYFDRAPLYCNTPHSVKLPTPPSLERKQNSKPIIDKNQNSSAIESRKNKIHTFYKTMRPHSLCSLIIATSIFVSFALIVMATIYLFTPSIDQITEDNEVVETKTIMTDAIKQIEPAPNQLSLNVLEDYKRKRRAKKYKMLKRRLERIEKKGVEVESENKQK